MILSPKTVLAAALLLGATPLFARVVTLEEAYERTLASDQSIRTAYLEIRKANLLPWSALTKLSPRLNADLNTGRSEERFRRVDNDSQAASFSYEQTLIDFTFFPAYRQAKLSGVSAWLQYRLTVRNVLFGVAKAYYQVLKQEKIIEGDRRALELASKQLENSKNRYEAGDGLHVDVLRGQSTLETARQSLIAAESTLAVNRDTLANLLNYRTPAERAFALRQPADAAPPSDRFEAIWEQARHRREELALDDIAIRQLEEQRNLIRGQYAPALTAQANKNWAWHNHARNADNWDARLAIHVPIFTGGQREIDLANNERTHTQAQLALEATTKEVESDVFTAWQRVQLLRETLASLEIQLRDNEKIYQDTLNRYDAGDATSLDTQIALLDFVNANTSHIAQTYEYQVALRDLERATACFQNQRVRNAKMP